jgi:hypothetical protein
MLLASGGFAMKLSAPIFRLKHRAKILAREKRIPRNRALDQIAEGEGYKSWSLLSAHASARGTSKKLYTRVNHGDLVLLGARPRNGKTLMCLRLAVEAMNSGQEAVFFSLDATEAEIRSLFQIINVDPARFEGRFEFDGSDDINAEYIIERLRSARPGTMVIIDYLQLLDQKRTNPELAIQVSSLKAFAKSQGLIMVFSSQIDRSYDATKTPWPDLDGIRLPNPLDLSLFDTTCFLKDGEAQIGAVGI